MTDDHDPGTGAGAPDARGDGGVRTLSKDDAFHILQNARRRAVLRYFLERDGQTTFVMRDVAEAVAAWEHGVSVDELTSDARQRVYIALYQSHLPKLDDHGLISYNQNRGRIECLPAHRAMEPFLADGFDAEREQYLTPQSEGTDDAVGAFFETLRTAFGRDEV